MGHDFNWGNTGNRIRDVIKNPDSIVDGHWPIGRIGNIGPANSSVEHHGASHIHNSANCAFGNIILMFSADPRITGLLVIAKEFSNIINSTENTDVSLIGNNFDANIVGDMFKTDFGFNRLGGSEVELMFNVSKARIVVNKTATATIHEILGSFPFGSIKTTRSGTLKVVHGDSLTREMIVSFKRALFFGGIFWG